MTAQVTAPGDRPTYTSAQIRACDLAEHDVAWLDGQWRSFTEVWDDDDVDRLGRAAMEARLDDHPDKVTVLSNHLTGHGNYLLVAYRVETPGLTDDDEIHLAVTPLHTCDLVTIQAVNGTVPYGLRTVS